MADKEKSSRITTPKIQPELQGNGLDQGCRMVQSQGGHAICILYGPKLGYHGFNSRAQDLRILSSLYSRPRFMSSTCGIMDSQGLDSKSNQESVARLQKLMFANILHPVCHQVRKAGRHIVRWTFTYDCIISHFRFLFERKSLKLKIIFISQTLASFLFVLSRKIQIKYIICDYNEMKRGGK